MECPICMDEFDPEKNADISTTPCCNQNIHTKCMNSTIIFYSVKKQNTPCPFCRSIVHIYVEPGIEISQNVGISEEISSVERYPMNIREYIVSSTFANRYVHMCCLLLFFQVVIIVSSFWMPIEDEIPERP